MPIDDPSPPPEANANAPPPTTTPSGQSPEAGPRRKWASLVVILVTAAIVIVPLLFVALPVEIAKWHLAAAQIEQRAGNEEAALDRLKKAEELAPHDAEVHLRRAMILRELGELPASLAAVDRAMEITPKSLQAHLIRCQILMEMKRFGDAAAALEPVRNEPLDPETTATVLNSMAYARALANEELELALQDINTALEYAPRNAAFLDTRGFVLYRQGEYREALADLDLAIGLTDLRRIEHRVETAQRLSPAVDVEESLAASRLELAVMLYHRGLVHEELGNTTAAQKDFAKVRELGSEPSDDLF